MKTLRSLFALTLLVTLVALGQGEKVSRIRIYVPDKSALDRIWSAGVDYEGATGKIGGTMEFVAGEHELAQLAARGVAYQVLIDDLTADYQRNGTPGRYNALGFGYGSMGGHYTYAEATQQLDSMKLLFPNLITDKIAIGRTVENRIIWAAKISSNPNINDPTKPEVLYTGLHHAREPMGVMSIVYYMYWLLENYGTSPEATYLVNNRQLWFVPILNVDGYEYNRSIAPNGGGSWRKNRRINTPGVYGVDLNRNYGPYYMWNSQIVPGGSSTDPSSDTYRGTTPFSEPETHAIDSLMRAHHFKTCINYHTYGSYLIFPWGYLARENADSLIYRDWAWDMTFDNRSTNGTDQQTVNYSTRGGSDDYMFGDTTKPTTYAMTPEVGIETDGFWAPRNRIFPLAQANLRMNKMLSYVAAFYPSITAYRFQDAGGNGFIDRGENFALAVTLKNRGLDVARNLNVALSVNTTDVGFTTTNLLIDSLRSMASTDLSFAGRVSGTTVTGVPFQVYLTFTDQQGFFKRDTLKLYIGTPNVVFADSASGGIGNWTAGTGWRVTTNAHTPPNAFTSGPYSANANTSLTLTNSLNLAAYNYAQLRFWTKWSVEPTWDFATVEVSSNNGASWTTLRTALSHFGSARSGSAQPAGTWGYDSYTPFGQTWVEQDADLTPFMSSQLKIRFRMASDGADQRDGFYVDDIRLLGFTRDALPDTGLVIRPSQFTFSGLVGTAFRDSLKIKNFTASSVQVTLAESTLTLAHRPFSLNGERSLDLSSILPKLTSAVRRAGMTEDIFKRILTTGTSRPDADPEAFTTVITDERGENGFGAADIYRVLYQTRSILGTPVCDFRIVMRDMPDSNIIGSISLDTDQDFGTGAFPTPYRVGPQSRDLGSEREIIFDASGALADSIIHQRIPAAIVINSTVDTISIVGIPVPMTVTRDSVLTITTGNALFGFNTSWLGDTDANMNLGAAAAHVKQGASAFPDFAPIVAHGTIGSEAGVSWLTEDRTTATIAAGDSATIRLTALAARLPGTYNARLRVNATGRPTISLPIQLNVTGLGTPHITVNPTSFRDTLRLGDSTQNTINLSNTGNADLLWGAVDTSSAAWLGLGSLYGTIPPGGPPVNASFRVNTNGLQAGQTYQAVVMVLSNDPANSTVSLPITLRVIPTLGIGENRKPIPTSFALHQNYPNPFNPETSISFDLPRSTPVSLRIYNLIGQEVATVVNRQLPAGSFTYKVGTGLSSGVYLYRLAAGDFVQTRKMVLLR